MKNLTYLFGRAGIITAINRCLGERRGVGGLFFDDLDEGGLENCFSFIATCGNAVLPSYIPMIEKHKDDTYTEKERNWQLLRRGK